MEPGIGPLMAVTSRQVQQAFEASILGRKRRNKNTRGIKRALRHVVDVVELRVKRMGLKASGEFDEVQREMKQELYFQYVAHQVTDKLNVKLID